MADPRWIVHQRVDDGLPSLGLPVAGTQIPRLAEFENAAAERRPLVLWKLHSTEACVAGGAETAARHVLKTNVYEIYRRVSGEGAARLTVGEIN